MTTPFDPHQEQQGREGTR